MYAEIEKRFSDAMAKNALVFTKSTDIRNKWRSSIDVVYTFAPSLAKKPTSSQHAEVTTKNSKQSPWLPPEEDLIVEKLLNYTVVLNKFALTKYHFLLVTNEFQKQTTPLSEDDLSTAFKILRQANAESERRHIGFFNCGPDSGASVDHKHIQFMTLPEDFVPFPDSLETSSNEHCFADNRMPFSHFIAKLSKNDSSEIIVLRYSKLLGHVLTTIGKSNAGRTRPSISYNLVFTEEWIMATPRSKETINGVSVNSLGTIGLFLTKSQEKLTEIESKGFELIAEGGFPFEEVIEYQPDHTGYTYY